MSQDNSNPPLVTPQTPTALRTRRVPETPHRPKPYKEHDEHTKKEIDRLHAEATENHPDWIRLSQLTVLEEEVPSDIEKSFEEKVLDAIDDDKAMLDILKDADQLDTDSESEFSKSPLLEDPANARNRDAYNLMIFQAMPKDLIRALLKGNLFSLVKGSGMKDLVLSETRNVKEDEIRPCIYGHFFGHRNTGDPLTARQMLYLIDKAEKYYEPWNPLFNLDESSDESVNIAMRVDNHDRSSSGQFSKASRQKKERRYVGPKKTSAAMATKVEKALKWTAGMRKYIKENVADADLDERMSRTTAEIGWARSPLERKREHASGASSVPLMNLLETLAKVYLSNNTLLTNEKSDAPGPLGPYVMQFYILLDVGHHTLASPAEHIISVLAGSYDWRNPFGLNTYTAGRSIESGLKMSVKAWDPVWNSVPAAQMEARLMEQHQRVLDQREDIKEWKQNKEVPKDVIAAKLEVQELEGKLPKARKDNRNAKAKAKDATTKLRANEVLLFDEMAKSLRAMEDLQEQVNAAKKMRNAEKAYYRDLIQKSGLGFNLKADWDKDYEIDSSAAGSNEGAGVE